MPTFIVITSIFPPTEAVRLFAARSGCHLVVIGDKKTPADWACPHVTFLSVDDQRRLFPELADVIPYNHYSRKMLGYLYAMRRGADVIIDTDDDNLPKADWGFPCFSGAFACMKENRGFVNVYSHYTDQHIWPRGFPLDRILAPDARIMPADVEAKSVKVGIWQGLADGDPDVDAIYRLTSNAPCIFRDGPPLVLGQGTLCPFNSQNTAFRKELFPLLYLPTTVSFRFTDILRGLVAQPLLWQAGYRLGYTAATVVQERNPHDYLKDFESEIPCYLEADRVIELARKATKPDVSLAENLLAAYTVLGRERMIRDQELATLAAWSKHLGAS